MRTKGVVLLVFTLEQFIKVVHRKGLEHKGHMGTQTPPDHEQI